VVKKQKTLQNFNTPINVLEHKQMSKEENIVNNLTQYERLYPDCLRFIVHEPNASSINKILLKKHIRNRLGKLATEISVCIMFNEYIDITTCCRTYEQSDKGSGNILTEFSLGPTNNLPVKYN
jgi:hypothetical protein